MPARIINYLKYHRLFYRCTSKSYHEHRINVPIIFNLCIDVDGFDHFGALQITNI